LKEVADKIMLRSEESESDDGSVSSSGGVVGMKGLLDCIFEVSYRHEESASSDDDDDSFERISREMPCKFCSKIFGSTMTRNTHILVAHAQQDSSVLNLRRLSVNEADRKDKSHTQKKHPRGVPKPDCDVKDTKTHYTSVTDRKLHNSPPQSENTPFRKRRSSMSKSQLKEEIAVKSVHRHQSGACQKKKESLPIDKSYRTQSSGLVTGDDGQIIVSQNEVVESICAGQPLGESDSFPEVNKSRESSGNKDEEPQLAEAPCSERFSEKRTDDIARQQDSETCLNTVDVPANTSASKIDINQKATQSGRKRKSTSPIAESASSSPASSNPKCLKKNTKTKSVSTSEHIQPDNSPAEAAPSDGRLRSRAGKTPNTRSSKRL
jgi:hypothetical protein